jgi:hypothetical protein
MQKAHKRNEKYSQEYKLTKLNGRDLGVHGRILFRADGKIVVVVGRRGYYYEIKGLK